MIPSWVKLGTLGLCCKSLYDLNNQRRQVQAYTSQFIKSTKTRDVIPIQTSVFVPIYATCYVSGIGFALEVNQQGLPFDEFHIKSLTDALDSPRMVSTPFGSFQYGFRNLNMKVEKAPSYVVVTQ